MSCHPTPALTMALAIATAVGAFSSRVQAEPTAPVIQPRVTEVLTATRDVHDIAVVGERVLLATSGGLVVRRGGQVEQLVTSIDGLPGTRLRAVDAAPDGQSAWVSSIEGVALVRLDSSGRASVERTLELRRVRRAARFAGSTWFASYGGGLFRLEDRPNASPTRVRVGSHPTHDQQTDLVVHGDELLVATAGAGLFRLGRDGRAIGRIRANRGLADDLIWRLVADGDRILVATAGGLSVVRGDAVVTDAREAQVASRLAIRDVRAALPVGDELWLGVYGGGVFRILPDRPNPQRIGGQRGAVATRRVQALTSAEGGVLIGHGGGLHRVSSSGGQLSSLSTGGLPSGDVTALERAFGALWVGTFTHGLSRITSRGATAVASATQRWGIDRRINDLAVTGAGTPQQRLWIATDRGLYWYDGRRFVEVIDPNGPGRQHTTNLHVQRSTNDLWVTSSRQLSRLHGEQWQSWTGDSTLPIVNLHAVTSDRAGNIWVGSLHGLFRFRPATGRFERHSVSSGALPVDWVTALVPWDRGIVAGTYHGGLSWYDGNRFQIEGEQTPQQETQSTGLPSGWVNPHALARVNGALWIGTMERGLAVGTNGRWARLDIGDGLPSDDVTDIIADGEHHAWIATRGGLARVTWQ